MKREREREDEIKKRKKNRREEIGRRGKREEEMREERDAEGQGVQLGCCTSNEERESM